MIGQLVIYAAKLTIAALIIVGWEVSDKHRWLTVALWMIAWWGIEIYGSLSVWSQWLTFAR
jgi:hypothetical protein